MNKMIKKKRSETSDEIKVKLVKWTEAKWCQKFERCRKRKLIEKWSEKLKYYEGQVKWSDLKWSEANWSGVK